MANDHDEMDLDGFEDELNRGVKAFIDFWKQGHKDNAELFPMKMEQLDWYEMYSSWDISTDMGRPYPTSADS